MAARTGFKLRLEPQDEYTHTPDAASNYNESMYFNVFDPDRKVGGWFRLGNRPNEGYAEMSVCLYLPDGRVAFMYGRPKIADNKAMNAGGMKIEVVEPFKRLKADLRRQGLRARKAVRNGRPIQGFPRKSTRRLQGRARLRGRLARCSAARRCAQTASRARSTRRNRSPRPTTSSTWPRRARFTIGGEKFAIDGFGLRDKSWGPRYWSAINWYRWCPMNFGRDFGMMLSIVAGTEGEPRQGGMVFKDGDYDLITECAMDTDWDENGYQTGLRAKVKTDAAHAMR